MTELGTRGLMAFPSRQRWLQSQELFLPKVSSKREPLTDFMLAATDTCQRGGHWNRSVRKEEVGGTWPEYMKMVPGMWTTPFPFSQVGFPAESYVRTSRFERRARGIG